MGKFKKPKRRAKEHRESLSRQILSTGKVKSRQKSDLVSEYPAQEERGEEGEVPVGPSLSSKILKLAREQQQELIEECQGPRTRSAPLTLPASLDSDTSSDSGSDVDDDFDQTVLEAKAMEKELGAQESASLDKFLPAEGVGRTSISDLIERALKEKREELSDVRSQVSGANSGLSLEAGVVSVYKKVGVILSRYRAGKVPKPFKVLPRLQRWEEILLLTQPDNWTAAAVYQATRLFASNAGPARVERFYRMVLLPRVRDDIAEFGKLNYHLYAALKKSLFKPSAFFKSILLPLSISEGCTLREACILASLLVKTSVPILHSGACLMKLAETNAFSGPVSVFMRVLISKQYCLPYRVLDQLVSYFMKFDAPSPASQQQPVLWHQCLLVLVQIYSKDMAPDQRQALLQLTDRQRHHAITPVIRKAMKESSQPEEGAMDFT